MIEYKSTMFRRVYQLLIPLLFFAVGSASPVLAHEPMKHMAMGHSGGLSPLISIPLLISIGIIFLFYALLKQKRSVFAAVCVLSLSAITFNTIAPSKIVCAFFVHEASFQATDHDCCSTAALPAQSPLTLITSVIVVKRTNPDMPQAVTLPAVRTHNPRAPPLV